MDDTTQFLEALSCLSIDDIKPTLKQVINPFPSDLDPIRSAIAKDFDYLSVIKTKSKNLALSKNTGVVWIQNASPKLSKFILETAPSDFLCIVKQKNSHSIKRAKTIVLNSSFNEFHIRFDGSYLSLNSNDSQVAELFGKTSITDISFAKNRYTNTNYPAVLEKNLNDNIFKHYEKDVICAIQKPIS